MPFFFFFSTDIPKNIPWEKDTCWIFLKSRGYPSPNPAKAIFLLFSTDVPRNILRVLVNRGIFPGIFLRISVEMVLTGLRDEYSWEFQGHPPLMPASKISTDLPRNILGDIPPLARALRLARAIKSGVFRSFHRKKLFIFRQEGLQILVQNMKEKIEANMDDLTGFLFVAKNKWGPPSMIDVQFYRLLPLLTAVTCT